VPSLFLIVVGAALQKATGGVAEIATSPEDHPVGVIEKMICSVSHTVVSAGHPALMFSQQVPHVPPAQFSRCT